MVWYDDLSYKLILLSKFSIFYEIFSRILGG